MNTPLIILHGALGSSDQFSELVNTFENAYSFDFSGHGSLSGSETSFEIDRFVEDLQSFIQTNKLENPSIFGYSMGGYVALKHSLMFPQVIQRILTLGTKFNWTPGTAAKEVKLLNPEIIMEKVPKFASRLEQLHGPDWENVTLATADMMIGLGNGKAMTEEQLSKVAIPVKICVGDQDQMVTLEESRLVSTWIPGAEFEILGNCKHPIELVDMDLLVSRIIQFMRN